MPLCLSFQEENSPYSSSTKERHKKRIVVTPYKSAPYHLSRSGMTVQHTEEKKEMSQKDKKQVVSGIPNRLPTPFQQPGIIAELISGFNEQSYGILHAKYRDDKLNKEEYEKYSIDLLENDNVNDIQSPPSLRLHMACTLTNPSPFVGRLLDDGESVNQSNLLSQTAIHMLVISGISNSGFKDALHCLLCRGASVNCKDRAGDCPLICVRYLLREEQYESAAHFAKCLLEAGANVDSVNSDKQHLLSYSLQHVDHSIKLTKILLNHGSSVWGRDYPTGDDNAFKWLLKGIMRQRKLDNSSQSLELIGRLMCNHPRSMESLVLRTMNRHSRHYQVYRHLFLGIQNQLKIYWKKPQSLVDLCRSTLRESFNHIDSPTESMSRITVPQVIKNYILMVDDDHTNQSEKYD